MIDFDPSRFFKTDIFVSIFVYSVLPPEVYYLEIVPEPCLVPGHEPLVLLLLELWWNIIDIL